MSVLRAMVSPEWGEITVLYCEENSVEAYPYTVEVHDFGHNTSIVSCIATFAADLLKHDAKRLAFLSPNCRAFVDDLFWPLYDLDKAWLSRWDLIAASSFEALKNLHYYKANLLSSIEFWKQTSDSSEE